MTRRGLTGVSLGVSVALAAAACGKAGQPVHPGLRLPRPPTAFTAVVENDRIEVAWTNPRLRADGTRLGNLAEARLYRLEDDGQGEPRPAMVDGGGVAGYAEVARVELRVTPGLAAPATEGPARTPPNWSVAGDQVRVVDREGLVRDRRYTYVVVAEDAERRVGRPSARLSVRFEALPAPPDAVEAREGDGVVTLAWRPAVSSATSRAAQAMAATGAAPAGGGSPARIVAHEITRALVTGGPETLLTPTPHAGPGYVDRAVENDRSYRYTVRTVVVQGPVTLRGPGAAPVVATPRDTTPPAAPSGLVAVPAPDGSVRLAWQAGTERDLATYTVFRWTPGGQPVRIGTVRAPAAVFVDRAGPPGARHYAVAASDSAARPNESPRSRPVTVHVP